MQFLFLFSLNAFLSLFHTGLWNEDIQPHAKQEAVCIGVRVSVKVFLEGPYVYNSGTSVGLMTTSLATPTLYIPTAQPYSNSPYAYNATTNPTGFKYYTAGAVVLGGGGETTTNAILTGSNGTNIGANAIVDWVFVELRDQTTPATVLETRAALLQADGDVVETDGTSAVYFSTVNCGSFYVGIRHRNHLAVRTSAVAMLSDVTTVIDFTATTPTYGVALTTVGSVDPRIVITLSGGGLGKAIYSGDTDNNNAVDAADRNNTWNDRNLTGYQKNDCSMNATVDAADRNTTWNNRNKTNQ
jgi:hypothetical protein